MRRAKKAKVKAAEEVETDDVVEPEPPEPFEFESPEPPNPICTGRLQTRAEEHRMELKLTAVVSTKIWKRKRREGAKQRRRLRAAIASQVAKCRVWEEQQKRASGMEHVRLWDKMMFIEDERVAGIKIEFLQSLAGELIAKNLAADAKIACRDATIRDLRARLRLRMKRPTAVRK